MKYCGIIGFLLGSFTLFVCIAGCAALEYPLQISPTAAILRSPAPITDQATVISVDSVETDLYFLKVNNITLYDNQQTVMEKLGQPDDITEDIYIKGLEIYEYPEMNIGFDQGMLTYVEVKADAGTVEIDETIIQITLGNLKLALGDPDYIAEDGIVFQRNDHLIKIYIDESTQKVTSIDYYHVTGT